MGTSVATRTMGPDRLAALRTLKVGVVKLTLLRVVAHFNCVVDTDRTGPYGTFH